MSTNIQESPRECVSLADIVSRVGAEPTVSQWVTIDQATISAFADATGDHAFIHTDPERAKRTRFGGTIAHGLLTLSLLPKLMVTATPEVDNVRMSVNYGFDRIRFVAPVPVDSRVRARVSLVNLPEVKPGFFHFTYDVTIEIEGSERPALIARWIVGRWTDTRPKAAVLA